MVKYLWISLILTSCVYKGVRNDHYKPRTNKIKIIKPDRKLLSQIDTMCVYEFKNYYFINSDKDTIIQLSNMEDEKYKNYIKFYNTGKLSLFQKIDKTKIGFSKINPKNSLMGRYYRKKDKIFIQYYYVFEGEGVFSKYEIVLKGNKLSTNLKGKGGIYIKKSLPLEDYIYWKPDW